ncbi:MAG: hypothetical protein A2030_05400 [Chloroflexi bacterium RBG_19FT_COMBO_50_10]|nr:MAG: hypothetical protein A2030_05400 [Chloroflexi bacterium RBG_19FT_COMBO_50_10]
MQLNTGQWVVVGVCGILIFGYILGYYYNRQRAEQIFRWLKLGLSTLGEVTLGEKLPGMATGGRLEVNQAAAPLKRVECVYLLAPRENLIFWVFNMLQRKGDELVIWVTYQSKPGQTVEVARRGDRQFDKRLKAADKPALSLLESPDGLQLAAEGKPGTLQVDRVQAFLRKYPNAVTRLALRPEKPHLFLRFNLRMISRLTAEQLFSELKELAG